MNKKLLSLAGAAVLTLTMNGSWAGVGSPPSPPTPPQADRGIGRSPLTAAPEIDIGAGGGAIVLLAGILLLLGESARRSS